MSSSIKTQTGSTILRYSTCHQYYDRVHYCCRFCSGKAYNSRTKKFEDLPSEAHSKSYKGKVCCVVLSQSAFGCLIFFLCYQGKGKGKGKGVKNVAVPSAPDNNEPTVRKLRSLDVFAGCGGD